MSVQLAGLRDAVWRGLSLNRSVKRMVKGDPVERVVTGKVLLRIIATAPYRLRAVTGNLGNVDLDLNQTSSLLPCFIQRSKLPRFLTPLVLYFSQSRESVVGELISTYSGYYSSQGRGYRKVTTILMQPSGR